MADTNSTGNWPSTELVRIMAHALEPDFGHLSGECKVHAQHTIEWCRHKQTPWKHSDSVVCSRPKGHAGPHIACYCTDWLAGDNHYNEIWL